AGVERPRSDVIRVLERSRSAFPDQRYTVEDRLDGPDRVALRLAWSGTHTGRWESAYGPVAATGCRFSISVIELYELAEGRIAGAWVGFDIRGAHASARRRPRTAGPDMTICPRERRDKPWGDPTQAQMALELSALAGYAPEDEMARHRPVRPVGDF